MKLGHLLAGEPCTEPEQGIDAAAVSSAEIRTMRATLDSLVTRMDTMGAKFDALFDHVTGRTASVHSPSALEAGRSKSPSRRSRSRRHNKVDAVVTSGEDTCDEASGTEHAAEPPEQKKKRIKRKPSLPNGDRDVRVAREM